MTPPTPSPRPSPAGFSDERQSEPASAVPGQAPGPAAGGPARHRGPGQAALSCSAAPGRHLGLYWPLAGEVDLRSLQALLPNQLALPAITAAPGDPAARLVYRPGGAATS